MQPEATVLVVDDEPGIRFFLTEALTRDGHRVVAADSGEAALECIAKQEFDLALIDLKMKGIGGIDVLTALHQQSPNTTAIILTAHGSQETAVEALRQGAHDYLLKPCKMDDLRQTVRAGLLKRRQKLYERAKSKYVSNISHDLRTPIASIGLNLHMLERSESEDYDYYLSMVKQEAARMKNLTEDVLAFSRLEAGQVTLEFAPVGFNAVVEHIVDATQTRAKAAGLVLIFEPDPTIPTIHAARNQLIRVVANLVANAIKYTPSGTVQVSTYLDAERGQVCIKVRDTGMGIHPDDLPGLFNRFHRGRRVLESSIPGTGLGLSIVKEIVDLHKGEITVESQVDKGSTFSVCLPLEEHEA